MRAAVPFALLLAAPPVGAVTVASGTVVLSAANSQQAGRLSRDGVPADWSTTKVFPGQINPNSSYAYTSIDTTFAVNRKQDIYYQISVDDPTLLAFVSAYLGAYDPAAKATNYLGDPGRSGNYFGVDPLFFQVVVPVGGSLRLVFNQTSVVSFSPATNYLVEAFSDTEFNENFATVAEPLTWAMLVAGFGLVGAAARRRRVVAAG